MTGGPYARVVVDVRPAHLDRPFDYRIPDGWDVRPGQRVLVPFAGRRREGWVVEIADVTEADRVLPLTRALGDVVLFGDADLRLYRWVASRWAGTLADVLRHALPKRVVAVEAEVAAAGSPAAGSPAAVEAGQRWADYEADDLLAATDGNGPPGGFWLRPLPGDETALAVALAARTLASGRAVVALAPDPASPLLDAVAALDPGAADLRPGRGDRARYRAFLRARSGAARVAVGERAAALAPIADLGLVLVEDEANPAYKERRSPRHHAREVALARARFAGATAVLTGDVPSAALWRLLGEGHVRPVRASRAVEHRRAPRVDVADLSAETRRTRFARPASRALSEAVAEGSAAMVLAARGGEGAALACQQCGHRLRCPQCDGSVRTRRGAEQRECPVCGWEGAPSPCAVCGAERTAPLAAGAGRLASELARSHPTAEVARMEGFDAPGPRGRPAIGVLTRGSVVVRPDWLAGERAAVLVIPDADGMRSRAALEAGEDALRLWMAAARMADRVVIQTREPRDAAVQALVRWDPDGFWEREAEWREALGFPPARSLVLLKAPPDTADEVASALRQAVPAEVLGPDPDGAVLVKTRDLRGTLQALRPLREEWGRQDRKVRVDVDPVPAG